MAGMGTAIWLMARLCRTTLRHPLLLIAGGGILESRCAPWELAEFWLATTQVTNGSSFRLTPPSLFSSPTCSSCPGRSSCFAFARRGQIYITQWYLLGAFLWFPWLYAAAQIMLVCRSGAGSHAGRSELVVCEQSSFPLVRRDRTRHGLLHDPESDRTSGVQLSFGRDRFLELTRSSQAGPACSDWSTDRFPHG